MGKLVLSRRELEDFVIFLPDGREVVVRVVDIERGKCRLAILADQDIKIMRREIIPAVLPTESA